METLAMNRKIKLLCLGLALVLSITACGVSKDNDSEDTKADKKTEKDINAEKQKEPEKYYDLLVEFVDDNFTLDGESEDSDEYRYILSDSSIITGESEFDNEYCYFDGYQLVDLNADDKPELLLRFYSDIYAYEVIAYEDEGEIKLSDSFAVDNQRESIFSDYANAAMIYKAKNGKDSKIIISGAEGSGAGSNMFVKELDDKFAANEIFFMFEDENSSTYKVNQKETNRDNFYDKLNDFLDSYELEGAYSFLNMTDDFSTTLEAVLNGEDEKEVDAKDWKTAYANKLMEIHETDGENQYGDYKFTIRCINDDEIPELLVSEGNSHVSFVDIYTYYMGNIVKLGAFGSYGSVYYSDSGIIGSSDLRQGNAYDSYYRIEKGTAVKIIGLHSMEDIEAYSANNYEGDIQYKYYINGRHVEEGEYKTEYDKMNEEEYSVVYLSDDGKEITKSNIESVFNEFTGNADKKQDSSDKENRGTNSSDEKKNNSGSSSQAHAESKTEVPTQTPFYNGSNKLSITSADCSSVLTAQQGNSYNASNVFDGNSSTAWAEGSSSNGVNEYVKVSLGSKQVVTMIAMINGYAKSDDLYHKNCRVKKAELSFSDGSTQTIELADSTSSIQKVFITPVETDFVKVTIKEVYDGDAYSDLCISEIEIYQ